MQDYISLQELSERFDLDKSGVRKYILKQGFSFIRIRTPKSRGQLALALTLEDAETIIEMRKLQGFLTSNGNRTPVNDGDGFFYIVQLIPELMEKRVKLGFATNVENRLKAHKTSAPTATLVKSWPSDKEWERSAIASITRIDCKYIGGEVFECGNLNELIERADVFFGIMP